MKLQDQKMALYACQRAIRSYMMAKTWLWLQLWLSIKPNLKCTQFGKFKKEYEDKISKAVRIENQAADVQKDLDQVNARIKGEKATKQQLEATMAKTNATVMQLEGEVATQEGVLAKAEQDRADKDDQIRTLKDEIAHQGDMITKLGKEKRSCADGRQKAKRKVEGDLKLTQEAVADLERVKGELQGAAARKDKEGSALAAKIDDEATLGTKYAKQAKELQARLEELDEELAVERGNRSKAEKSRTMLKKDIEDIASRLEEAGSNTATQVELNKKREGELARLKAELEELNIAHEGTLAALRMKHNNTMADLGEQIDSLNANKVKSEKDKANMELDLRDTRCDLEEAVKGKADLDKSGKLIQGNIA